MIHLYDNPVSPNSRRVRVLAAEIGVPIKTAGIDFTRGEQQTPDFLAKNPNGKIPTIEIGGRYLWESPALLYELASERPDSNLVPADLHARAEMLRWMFWNASHFEPAIFGLFFERWIKRELLKQDADPARVAVHERDFARFAKVFDGHMAGHNFVIGDAFSIADIAIGTSVDVTRRADVSLGAYPAIERWLGRLTARKSWNA